MKILAVGDIVGENGLKKLKEVLPNLKKKENIDFVIVMTFTPRLENSP